MNLLMILCIFIKSSWEYNRMHKICQEQMKLLKIYCMGINAVEMFYDVREEKKKIEEVSRECFLAHTKKEISEATENIVLYNLELVRKIYHYQENYTQVMPYVRHDLIRLRLNNMKEYLKIRNLLD